MNQPIPVTKEGGIKRDVIKSMNRHSCHTCRSVENLVKITSRLLKNSAHVTHVFVDAYS